MNIPEHSEAVGILIAIGAITIVLLVILWLEPPYWLQEWFK